MHPRVIVLGVCAAAVVSAPAAWAAPQSPQAACDALRTLDREHSQVIAAAYMPAGELPLPKMGPYTPPPLSLPAHCAVRVSTATGPDSRVISDVWLPDAAVWNGKLLATGNGGYASTLSYTQMADGLRRGYAVAGSDTGHEGDGLSFGDGHPERIRDWAYRSTHVLAADAKAVVTAFYGKAAAHAYFAGCSTGGQQALSEAQRYPADFDGIVAGDPGNDRIRLNADFVESWELTHPPDTPAATALPAVKLPLITRAAVAACNRQDGTPEPYINDPRACGFDPATLACAAGVADAKTATCLTPREVEIVRTLYAGAVRDAAGHAIFPGWPRGSEAGWAAYLVSPPEPVRAAFWTSWVFDDPRLDLRAVPATTLIATARAKLPFVEAVDPDLRPFARAGGRLLLYHGWADPVVPPEDTVAYVERVRQVMGTSADAAVRLFMVPGMGHCGGGPGATSFDALGALDRWVTAGDAPATLLASHMEAGKPTFQRPLCAFPQSAQYNGASDPASAASFRCVDAAPASRTR